MSDPFLDDKRQAIRPGQLKTAQNIAREPGGKAQRHKGTKAQRDKGEFYGSSHISAGKGKNTCFSDILIRPEKELASFA
jgi:hypothetical protein